LAAALSLLLVVHAPPVRSGGRAVAVYANDIDWGLCRDELEEAASEAGASIERVTSPGEFGRYDAVIVLGGHRAPTDASMPVNVAGDLLTESEREALEREPDAVLTVRRVSGGVTFYVLAGSDRYDTRRAVSLDLDGDGCGGAAEALRGSDPERAEPLWGVRVLLVLAYTGFQDLEYRTVRERLEGAGAEVLVASNSPGEASGMSGARARVDLTLGQVDPSEFDAVVFIGGMGTPQWLWGNPEAHRIAREAASSPEVRVLAAICLAPAVLAEAGVLSGLEATVYPDPEAIQKLERGGAVYVEAPVVVSGKVITGSGPGAASEFASEILEALTGGGT